MTEWHGLAWDEEKYQLECRDCHHRYEGGLQPFGCNCICHKIVQMKDNSEGWSKICERCSHYEKDHRTRLFHGQWVRMDCDVQIHDYSYMDHEEGDIRHRDQITIGSCPCEQFL